MATRHEIDIIARNKTKPAMGEIQSSLQRLNKDFGLVTKAAGAFIGALAIREVAQFGKEMINISSTFQTYRNQLRLITDGQEDLERVFGNLIVAAKENRTAFSDTVDLFTKLRVTTEQLGVSEEQVIKVTGNLSKALQLAGADGNTASSVIRQFGQAMASGEVRGDEFRSLVEGLGPALAIMARETGITVGELRKMSRAGELNAEVMFNMLENSTALENAFNSQRPTIDQLETALGDAFQRAVAETSEAIGLTSIYEDAIKSLTETFDRMAGIEDPFENMSFQELADMATSDNIKEVASALEEVNDRYLELLDLGPVSALVDFFKEGRTVAQSIELMNSYKELGVQLDAVIEKLQKKAEEDKELADAYAAELGQIQALLKPYQKYIDLTEKYSKQATGTRVEQLTAKQAEAEQVIQKLTEAQNKLNLSDDQSAALLELNQEQHAKLTKQIQQAIKVRDHYTQQIDAIAKAEQDRHDAEQLREFERYQKEQQRIRDEQAAFKEKWTDRYKTVQDALKSEQQLLEDAYQDQLFTLEVMLKNQFITRQEYNRTEKALFSKHQKELSEIQKREAEKRRLEEFRGFGLSESQAEDLNEQIKLFEEDKGKFIIKNTGDILKNLGTFNKKAFEAYKAFAIAEAMVNTYKGAAAAIGSGLLPPFNFIAAAAVVAAGLAQVNAIRSQTYSGRMRGGPVSNNQPYIVGEAGPEVFVPNQNGKIVPNQDMFGKQVTVNFNIDTTDARGFDELLNERQGLLVNIINDAVTDRGKEALI